MLKFSKQAELDFMHNFRHDTEGDRWAKHEIETLRQHLAALTDNQIANETQAEQHRAERDAEVKLLRGALLEICNLPNKYPGHRALRTIEIATTALIATEPKP